MLLIFFHRFCMSSIFIAVKSSYLPCRSTAPLVLPVKDAKVRVHDKIKTELELGRHGRMLTVTGFMQAPAFHQVKRMRSR